MCRHANRNLPFFKLALLLMLLISLLSACSPDVPSSSSEGTATAQPAPQHQAPPGLEGKEILAWQGDVAWFKDETGLYGLCNRNGDILAEPYYQQAGPFIHDVAVVERGSFHKGLMNRSGQLLGNTTKWAFILPMSADGVTLAMLRTSEPGAWSTKYALYLLDNRGNEKLLLEDYSLYLQDAIPFQEGIAAYKAGSNWQYIDKNGNKLFEPVYSATPFNQGLAMVWKWNKSLKQHEYYGIDTQGNNVAGPFEYAGPFSEGLAAVKINGKWGYIDAKGQQVIPPGFDAAEPFSHGYAVVYDGSFRGAIDRNGQVAVPFKWAFLNPFDGSLFTATSSNGGCHGLDSSGAIVFGPVSPAGLKELERVVRIGPFSEGYATLTMESHVSRYTKYYGYVDKSGQLIISLKSGYGEAMEFLHGMACYETSGHYRYFNTADELVAEISY